MNRLITWVYEVSVGPFKTLRKYRIKEKSIDLPFDSFQTFYSSAQYPGTRHFPYNRPIKWVCESAHYMGLGGFRGPFQYPTQLPDRREIPKPTLCSFQTFYSFAQYTGTRLFPYKTPVTRFCESAHYQCLGGVRRPFQDPTHEPDRGEFSGPAL